MRAHCLIRDQPHYRSDAFRAGLRRAGYDVTAEWPQRGVTGDVLIIWNRYYEYAELARRFEKGGGLVLVAENGYLGVEWNGHRWYALSAHQHNGAGVWPRGDASRWERYGVELAPWRKPGREIVVLPQRGIGPPGVAMPDKWDTETCVRLAARTRRPVRVRPHPGQNRPDVSLEQDLANAWAAVTWGSGAAIKALAFGVPVFHDFPQWIGAPAARPLSADLEQPFRGDRLPMFHALAWAMWTVEEIASGDPFVRLVEACAQGPDARAVAGVPAS